MKLSRTTPVQTIEIRMPRWKERTVGVASFRVGTHNAIDIIYKNKEGKRLYPEPLYASGETIKSCPTQTLPSGVVLHLVPIARLEPLERE